MNDVSEKNEKQKPILKQTWADITDEEEKNELYNNECQRQPSAPK